MSLSLFSVLTAQVSSLRCREGVPYTRAMISDRFVEDVVGALTRAGLTRIDPDDRRAGGFGVQLGEGFVGVVWSPSRELSHAAFEQLQKGNVSDPIVMRMGRVIEVMATAMVQILHASGFDARMSTDDMMPEVVEVRPG